MDDAAQSDESLDRLFDKLRYATAEIMWTLALRSVRLQHAIALGDADRELLRDVLADFGEIRAFLEDAVRPLGDSLARDSDGSPVATFDGWSEHWDAEVEIRPAPHYPRPESK